MSKEFICEAVSHAAVISQKLAKAKAYKQVASFGSWCYDWNHNSCF